MSPLQISPLFIALAGTFLLFLGYRAIRKRKMLSSAGTEQDTKTFNYYLKVTGSLVGGMLALIIAGIGFYESYGVWTLISYGLIVLAIVWWIYKFRWLKLATGKRLKRTFLPQKSQAESATPRLWALASIALLSLVNGRDHETLGGSEPSLSSEKRARKRLRKDWDIRTQEDFDEIQEWLLDTGHRSEFNELIEKIMNSSKEEVEAHLDEIDQELNSKTERAEEYAKVEMIQERGAELKSKGFLAWDYLRYMDNCRAGYLAGYLEEGDAWDQLLSVAQVLQSRYDSWQELGETYLLSREFWSVVEENKNGKLYHRSLRKLLHDPKSPWNRLAWDVPLYSRT